MSHTSPTILAVFVLVFEIPGLVAYLGAAVWFFTFFSLQTNWGALFAVLLTSLFLTVLLIPVLLTSLFFLIRSTLTHLRFLRLQLAGLLLCLASEVTICIFMLTWSDPSDRKDMLIPSLILGVLHGFPYIIGTITGWVSWINNPPTYMVPADTDHGNENRASMFTSLLHGEVVHDDNEEGSAPRTENSAERERRPLLSDEN
ncbi:hypothetical protein BGZ60DRAFT_409708 [Tricladium varicosporioides]|nr:hypothetical protein BGZ60DRAFT_409708 [Hymenoscyphus varicosporioides]